KSRKYDPRNASTSGTFFTRSVMKTPNPPSTTRPRATGLTVGSAPHQSWPEWNRNTVATIPSAAGVKTLAGRVRQTHLEAMPIADAEAETYHGSCGLSTIATIRPVRIAPLGNSQHPRRQYRIGPSIAMAAATAPARLGPAWRTPTDGRAKPSIARRMRRSSPFGVRKKRAAASSPRSATAKTGRLEPLERRRDNEAIDAVAPQQPQPLIGTEHERRGCQRVGQHRARRDDGHARRAGCRLAGTRIEQVMIAAGTPLVVARGAHRLVRRAEPVDNRAVKPGMTDADRPGLAARAVAADVQIAAGIDDEGLERFRI